jgi:hypothetical protein
MLWYDSTSGGYWGSGSGVCDIAVSSATPGAIIGSLLAGLVIIGVIMIVVVARCCKHVVAPLAPEDICPYARFAQGYAFAQGAHQYANAQSPAFTPQYLPAQGNPFLPSTAQYLPAQGNPQNPNAHGPVPPGFGTFRDPLGQHKHALPV